MPKRKADDTALETAKHAAQAQFNDLLHELEMLVELFPHLKDGLDKKDLPVSFLLKQGAEKSALRAARAMSAAKKRPAPSRQKSQTTKPKDPKK